MKPILACLLLCGCCLGQTPVRTLTVVRFGDLERRLASSADAAARAQFLTDDFEERECAAPGTPVPRDQWLALPAPKFSFTQEAVHDYGDTAVYSALGTTKVKKFGLVDVWKKQGDGWKLAVRYRCPATGSKPESTTVKRY